MLDQLFRSGDCPPLRRWGEPWRVALFALMATFFYFIIGFLLSPFGISSTMIHRTDFREGFSRVLSLFLYSISYPFIATIIAQWFPFFLVRWLRKPISLQILFVAFWFTLFYLHQGAAEFMQKFGVGWVLAACFVFQRKESWVKAYRVTSLSHAFHNLIVFLTFLLYNYFGR